MQRGDTLVEVLVSMAILAMVVVGASTLINGGLGAARNAVEHTQVRNSIQQQSEFLHYLRDNQTAGGVDPVSMLWNDLIDAGSATAAPVSSVADSCQVGGTPGTVAGTVIPTGGKEAYYLELNAANVIVKKPLPTLSRADQAALPGRGLWIEAVRRDTPQRFVDFSIRAC